MYTETVLASDSSTRLQPPKVLEVELPQADSFFSTQTESQLNEQALAKPAPTAHLATAAGVAVRAKSGLGIESVVWRLVDDAHTLTLEPLDTNGEPAGYAIIHIRLPGSGILANFVQATDDRGLGLVIDFFTTEGIMYTVVIDYKQFSASEFDTTQPWRVMKQPVAFDLVKPQAFKAVSATVLLLSLADGSLLKFTRKDPLASLESHQLEDSFAPSGFGWMFRGDDKVEGRSYLSKRTVIAIDSCRDIVATYGINNELKLWSISRNRCLSRKVCAETQAPLRLQNRPYIRFDETGQHLAAYVPLGGQPGLVIYQVADDNLEPIHQTMEPGPKYASWMLTELLFSTLSESFRVIAAWQSNLSSVVKTVSFPRTPQGEIQSSVAVICEAKTLLSLPDEADLDLFIAGIFSGVHYSDFALRRGLQVFSNAPLTANASLQEHARRAVQRAAQLAEDSSKKSLRLQWLRLDRICREIEAQSAELLGIAHVPSSDLVWILRSGYTALLSPQSRVSETLEQGLLADLVIAFPKQALYDVYNAVNRLVTNPSDRLVLDAMEMVYELISQHHITLPQTPNLDELLGSQISAIFTAPATRPANSPLTPLGAELVARIVTDFAQDAQRLLVRVIAVTVLAVAQGSVSNGTALFASAVELFKSAAAILSLREAMGTKSVKGYGAWASGLEIGIASSQIKVDGQTLPNLPQLLWRSVDVSRGPRGLELFYDLSQENYTSITSVAQYLPQTAAGVFVKGLGLLRVNGRLGKHLILSVAPSVALRPQPDLAFLGTEISSGAGFSLTYLTLSRLAEAAGALEAALHFAKLAAQSPVAESQRQLQHLALAAGDLDCVYQVICVLHTLGDAQIKSSISLLLEAAAKQGKAEHVVRYLPFIGMAEIVHDILTERTEIGGIPTHKLLYVWCIAREDYVGAATAIYKSLAKTKPQLAGQEPSEDIAARFDWYTILLNALKCANEEDRWMIVDSRVVTIKDVEQEYLSLLSSMTQSLPAATASSLLKMIKN